MDNSSSSPSLTNVTISDNSAEIGGGMYNMKASSPTLTNVIFSGNSAELGGGMYNRQASSPTLTNVSFNDNSANDKGGAMCNSSSSPTLTNVSFNDNSANDKGGAMCNSSSSPTLTNVNLSGNSAELGGAMANYSSSPMLANVSFSCNSAELGGGMYNWGAGSPALTNVTFCGNSADSGGGMYNGYSSPTLTNVTLSGNSATVAGGGIYSLGNSPTLTNSILWDNTATDGPEIFDDDGSNPAVSYSIIQGGWSGEGNLDADPLFVRPPSAGDDGTWGTDDDDYGDLRLRAGSPAIDVGDNGSVPDDLADLDGDGITAEPTPFDLDMLPRFFGSPPIVDMGAYEYSNRPPVADAGGAYAVPEGGSLQLEARGTTDPDLPGDTLAYHWDLDDDGQYDDAEGATPTVPWATLVSLGLASDGTATPIAVRVVDARGENDTAGTTLTINNVDPTADAGGPHTIDEGQALLLDASASSDPGGDALTYAWDLDNDGQYNDATGATPIVSWATLASLGLASDGTSLSIGVQVDDGDGGIDTVATTLVINNLDPTADAGGPYTIDEGQDLLLDASASTDPGGDTLSYAWDLDNDGQYDDAAGAIPTVPWNTLASLGPASDGTSLSIGVQVDDGDGGIDTVASTLVINNLDPTADAGGPYALDEGHDLMLDGSASTDPGGDTLTYAWDLDNDGQYDDATGATPTVPWNTLASLGLASDGTSLSIGVQVEDGEGGINAPGTTLVINNLAPTAHAGGPYTIDEGQDLLLDASASTDPGGDTLSYAWDLDNDGQYDDAAGATPTVPWNTLASLGLASDGTSLSIGVQVEDGEGGINAPGTTLVINNLAPTAHAGGPYTIDEGQDLLLDASASTDPGGDTLTYTWDLDDDGQYDDAAGATPTVPWNTLASLGLASDGTSLSIGVQVDDGDGGIDTVATTLVVNNLDPTADAGGPYTIDENHDLLLDASASTDAGGDALTYAWDLDNDGQYDDATSATPTVPWATLASLGLASDGTSLSIGVQVDDGEGGINASGTTLVINNLAPTANAGGPYTMDEGHDLLLDASASTDPGGDALTYTWDLDNDGQYNDATGATPTVPWSTLASLGLASDGTSLSIGVQVDDGDGGIDTVATTLVVNNLDPTADAGGPYTIDENHDLLLDASASTDAGGDALTYAWDLDNDGQYDDATSATPTVPWATLASLGLASDGTSLSIGVQVDDGEGGINASGTTLVINNLAPTANAGGPYTMDEGHDLLLDASASTDPGGDALTYTWDLDNDGQYNDATGATPTVPWSTLASLGLASDGTSLSIVVQVEDGEGGVDTVATTLVVNNLNPTANAGGPYTIDEGQDLLLDASVSSDPGGDTLTYAWDLDNDGQYDDAAGATPTVPWATLVSLGLASDGTFGATLHVTDEDGADETYVVRVSGSSNEVNVTLVNLVSHTDTEVAVSGTDEADSFEFSPMASYLVTINGVEYHFDDAQYETIVFTGGEGEDTAALTGGVGDEIARLFPDHGTFGENGFLVTVDEVVEITAHGGGGLDAAFLYDSAGDDEFVSRKGYGRLSGDGFVLETFDFMTNYGYATTADGGTDVAYLEDAPANDKFKFDWPKAGQFFGKMYGGGGYYNRAKNFEQIEAVMTEGKDRVRLFDSEGDDVFYGQKNESRLVGDGFDVTVSGYDMLATYASVGMDVANFEDSEEDDTARARAHKITLWGGDDADPTYEIMARKFDEYKFEGKNGGYDRAKLHDTVLNDHVYASGKTASLYANDGELDLLYEVAAFEWVRLYGSEGQDTVEREEPLEFDLVYDAAMWD